MDTKNIKDGEIITDDKGNSWLYLYGIFSSFEPNKEKREKLFQIGLKENIRNLYNMVELLNNN